MIPVSLQNGGWGFNSLKEEYFTSNEEMGNLGFGMRIAFRTANLFPFIRKTQRLLIYKVHESQDNNTGGAKT